MVLRNCKTKEEVKKGDQVTTSNGAIGTLVSYTAGRVLVKIGAGACEYFPSVIDCVIEPEQVMEKSPIPKGYRNMVEHPSLDLVALILDTPRSRDAKYCQLYDGAAEFILWKGKMIAHNGAIAIVGAMKYFPDTIVLAMIHELFNKEK